MWTDLMQQVHMPPTGASCRKTHCHHQPYKQMEYFFRFTSWILNTFQGQCSFFFFIISPHVVFQWKQCVKQLAVFTGNPLLSDSCLPVLILSCHFQLSFSAVRPSDLGFFFAHFERCSHIYGQCSSASDKWRHSAARLNISLLSCPFNHSITDA